MTDVMDEINELRRELHELLDEKSDYNKIYEISVRLDKLIIEFYNTKKQVI